MSKPSVNRVFSKFARLGRATGRVAHVEDGPRIRYLCDHAGQCPECSSCHHAIPHKPRGLGWRNLHGPCHTTSGECGFLRMARGLPFTIPEECPTVQCLPVVVGTNNGRDFPPMTEEVSAALAQAMQDVRR